MFIPDMFTPAGLHNQAFSRNMDIPSRVAEPLYELSCRDLRVFCTKSLFLICILKLKKVFLDYNSLCMM